ncbi:MULTISPECIES: S9 family peptidase [Paenibacillus]|uniref:Peptidase n=2 Tax=Paenibacillus TaxID=44249 RepID=A0ABX2ZIP9_PAEPO|nr:MULTISPECIES: S9 family peptidase [Paenibacillus]MDR6780000.1 dipeptidyl aminopeptidase/acylaminoacyl peptidase [Paenibacillus peoriae]ODA11693.1 peptidase [Paenibacillus polymyxa]OME68714.1 peptidase S9 family protein [Paenibacillus peoriae]
MNKRSIVPEDLYGYQWISDPTISPDGTIAYVNKSIDRPKNDYQTHIRVASLLGNDDQPLTGGHKDSAPAWSPDGLQLAFLRLANGSKQLWTVPAEGGEGQRQTEVKRGVSAFVWSPDGKYIVFTSMVSIHAEREAMGLEEYSKQSGERGRIVDRTTPKAEGSGWWNGLFSHLYVLELENGRITPITSGPWNASYPVWSTDSKQISFLSKRVDDDMKDADMLSFSDVYTIDCDGGNLVKVTDSSLAISQFSYAPDGKSLTLIASDRIYGSGSQNRLYTVPVTGGAPELLVPELDMKIGNFALSDMKSFGPSPSPLYAPARLKPEMYVLGTLQGAVHIYRITMDGDVQAVTGGSDRDIYQYTLSDDGRYLVFAALDVDRPGELYQMNLETGEEKRLTHHNDDHMASLQVSSPETFWFEASDGFKVQGWIFKPAGMVPGDQVPLILQIHGGPHAMYTGTYSHEMQTLLAQGYAVLMTNPRGSFGYGQDFAQACRGDFGGGDYRDLLDALDFALNQFDCIDETRLGVAGGSYGGLMTNWIISHTNRFRAAVTQRCISNWLSFYGLSDIGISYTEGIVGANPWEDPELLWFKSPLAHVNSIETPLLILHGEEDLRCPVSQGDELFTALKRLGKITRLIRYPGSNHSLLKSGKPSLRVDNFEQVVAWFNSYLSKGVYSNE